jgi:redox-sensitive bicupin YhaK (pirin superfamily)
VITLRPSETRGHANHGWLDSYHSFSFANYYDPEHMGFRALRVINEDWIAGGGGFATHPHRDMEILTYVLEGALAHQDSLGNGSIIRPGDVQRMSAGTGVTHSEYNASKQAPARLLQIWLLPNAKNLAPSYEQTTLPLSAKPLVLIASGTKAAAVAIHQDVDIYRGLLPAGATVSQALDPARHAWIQVAAGSLYLNDQLLNSGDGAQVSAESRLEFRTDQDAEFLLFDLA